MPLTYFTRQIPSGDPDQPPAFIYYILPKVIARPIWLALFGFLPWAALFAFNLWLFYPVWGEMTPDQYSKTLIWFGACATGGMIHAAVAAVRAFRRELVKWPELIALVLLSAGYLWLSVDWIGDSEMIPSSVTRWILPIENLMGIQFCLVAPPLFFSLLQLACFETRSKFLAGPGAALLVVIAGPVVFFLATAVLARLADSIPLYPSVSRALGTIFLIVFVPITLLPLAGVLRLGSGTFLWTRHMKPLPRSLVNGAFCLLMPVGGLLLNREIPFPTDFQSPLIYILTVVNGAILTFPVPATPTGRKIRWLALAVAFPFSLYFFLIFLPWMPLAIPAMIAFGSGFLILSPIILFSVHLQELLQGWEQSLDERNWLPPWVQLSGALCLVPGILLVQALGDRAALRQALGYAYRSPYQTEVQPIDAKRAAATLLYMREMQKGMFLPLLSDTYKSLVFDGMVLQQAKLAQLYLMYTGKELPAADSRHFFGFYGNEPTWRGNGANPFAGGHVTTHPLLIRPAAQTNGQWTRYDVDLNLKNESNQPGEFIGHIHLPEGVWVTGLELDLNGTMVPARIFEKKTALWVYEKIRDTEYRRDPGLILYTSPGQLELRIFPFTANQARPARLTLLAAPGVSPDIQMDGLPVPSPVEGAVESADLSQLNGPRSVSTPDGPIVLLPPGAFSSVTRPRRLHFVIDRSIKGPTEAEAKEAIDSVIKQTGIDTISISEANFKTLPHKDLPPGSTSAVSFKLPAEGGFSFERAVKTLIAEEDRSAVSQTDVGMATFFVAVVKDPENLLKEERGKGWLGLSEDAPVYGIATPRYLTWQLWNGGEVSLPPPQPVGVVKSGGILRAFLPEKQSRALEFPGTQNTVSIWGESGWIPVAPLTDVSPEMHSKMQAWMAASNLDFFPEKETDLFPAAVRLSRDAEILTAPTSFMIVENSAQWKMLERKEKQKTGTAKEFDFEEQPPDTTPEPATWMLLLGAGAVFVTVRYFKNTKRNTIFPS